MGHNFQLLIAVLLFFINAFDGCSLHAQDLKSQTTIILSLDGFRWDYPDKTSTPVLNMIAREGVKAFALIPSFPSKTFPNHYTIATGLVPDHHGLVNNAFYDSKMGKSFSINNKEARINPAFYGGEPIWITAQKQGVKTASFYWVGSDVAIMGQHPDIWKDYIEDIPFIERIDTIIKWLTLPKAERPRLIMAYYHEPDGAGHAYGPDDARTLQTVREIDSLIGIFYKHIKQLPDGDSINLLIVADHGMGNVTSEQNIVLHSLIPESWPVMIEGGTPNFNLYAEGVWVDSAFKALSRTPHLKVWKPTEVPGYLNYGTNPRVGDIIVVADSAWSVSLEKPKTLFWGGTHGYDTRNTDMHAIFYAVGPAFKQNYLQPAFQNIHIYPLLAYLLNIKPAHTDGDLRQVINMLKPIK